MTLPDRWALDESLPSDPDELPVTDDEEGLSEGPPHFADWLPRRRFRY